MKPNLFIVGAPKCGTTAWVEYLRTHPEIFFPEIKEPHHFSTDLNRRRGVFDRASYLDLYSSSAGEKIRGDASASYLYSAVAARQIRAFNPDAKILIFLRPQESQLPSWHNELLKNGTENLREFGDAWRLSGKRDRSNTGKYLLEPKYLDYKAFGRFNEQVERYFAEFPPEQIRVFWFSDWIDDPRPTYLEIMRFLDIGDDGRADFPPVNEAHHLRSVALLQFLSSPPPWARGMVRAAKALMGKPQLGWAERIGQLNRKAGYRTIPPTGALLDEVRRFYEFDNRELHHRIWRGNK